MRWKKKSKEKKRKMFFLLRLCTASFNLIGCAASALGIGNTTIAPSEDFSELWLATVWLQNQTRAIRCSSRTLPVRPSSIPGHQRVKRGQVPSEGQKQVAVVQRRDAGSTRGKNLEEREAHQEGQQQLGIIWDPLHRPDCDHIALLQPAQPGCRLWKLEARTTGEGSWSRQCSAGSLLPPSFLSGLQ